METRSIALPQLRIETHRFSLSPVHIIIIHYIFWFHHVDWMEEKAHVAGGLSVSQRTTSSYLVQ